MASTVETIQGPIHRSDGVSYFRHMQCKLSGLGERESSRADIIMNCPSNTVFQMFVEPPKRGASEDSISVDLLELDKADLVIPENQAVESSAASVLGLVDESRTVSESKDATVLDRLFLRHWLSWIAIVVGGVMVATWIRARRMTRHGDG